MPGLAQENRNISVSVGENKQSKYFARFKGAKAQSGRTYFFLSFLMWKKRFKVEDPKWKIHVVMPGDVIHITALGEQNIDFTKIGISDNF